MINLMILVIYTEFKLFPRTLRNAPWMPPPPSMLSFWQFAASGEFCRVWELYLRRCYKFIQILINGSLGIAWLNRNFLTRWYKRFSLIIIASELLEFCPTWQRAWHISLFNFRVRSEIISNNNVWIDVWKVYLLPTVLTCTRTHAL